MSVTITAKRTIGFIGGGNMAEAMIRGLLRGEDFQPAQVSVSGPREERMRELREAYGIDATTDNHVPASAQIVVLSSSRRFSAASSMKSAPPSVPTRW